MKRTWRVLLSLLLLAAPAAVQAQYTVSTNSDTTINIVRDTGAFGNVSVPASINSLPVTTVGQYAFANISNLTSVVFPSGVAGIGGFAFYLSTNLTNVGIPSTVTNIGTNVFADCYSLQAISVDPANLFYSSVGGALFDYSQITLLQFPEARSGSFTIPNTVTSVGNYAFAFCQGLTGVTIPSSVTNLGNFAFDFCTNLSSVTIGSVTNFGSAVFAGCTNLSAIMVDPANSFYTSSNGVLFNKSQTTLLQCPEALAGGSYTIPAGVTTIESNAFQYCLLTNLTIPNTVTNIGDYAFPQSRLTSVTINDGVPDIGTNAFYECYSLTNVLIPASVTN